MASALFFLDCPRSGLNTAFGLFGIQESGKCMVIGCSVAETLDIGAFMSTNVKTIGPGESPVTAEKFMLKHDIGRLPVVREGRMIGIVTRSGAMRYFYDLLPE